MIVIVTLACSAEQRYERTLARVEAPGGQLSVIEASGGRYDASAGEARPGVPLTVDAPLLVGSNTKLATAAAVLQLVEEGALALDEPAASFVPQLDPAITVRSLLQQTSGLGEYSQHPAMTADDAAAMEEPWEPEELIALGQEVAADPPGDLVRYANTNYIALGLILEAVDGEPLDRVLARRVFEPLGLVRTGLATAELPEDLAWGDGGAFGQPSLWDASVGWAAGSMYAPAEELAELLRAAMSGELYSEELLAEQLTPARWDEQDAEGVDVSYGLGVMLAEVDGVVYYGHEGGLAGFASLSLLDPGSGAVAAVAFNGTEVDVITPAFDALGIASRR